MVLKLNSIFINISALFFQVKKWNKSFWEQATENIVYHPVNEGLLDFIKSLLTYNNLSVLKIILLIIFAVVLILGIVFFVKRQLKLKKTVDHNKEYSVSIEEIEDKIKELNLFDLLNHSIENEEYKKAIRIQYLILLKELDLKKHIKIKKNKTNKVYINELKNTQFRALLISQTIDFERVWYGDVDVFTSDEFNKNNVLFTKALNRIKNEE